MKTMSFRIGEIQPNPFRAIERYPLRPEKINALRESFRTAGGFWNNIVARIRDDGRPEIAYGHHRLEALRQDHGPEEKISLIIRDPDDETMLQMMLKENEETWNSCASVEQESLRAVVEAYGSGRIELPHPGGGHSQHRHAPSFQIGETSGADLRSPYSAGTLAEYMGWDQTKVEGTLNALELVEKRILTEKDYGDLSTTQARALTREIRYLTATGEILAAAYQKDAQLAERQRDRAIDEGDRSRAEAVRTFALERVDRAWERSAEEAHYLAALIQRNLKDGTWSTRMVSGEVQKRFKPKTLRTVGLKRSPSVRGKREDPEELVNYFEELDLFLVAVSEAPKVRRSFSFEALVLARSQHQRVLEAVLERDRDVKRRLGEMRDQLRGGLLEHIR